MKGKIRTGIGYDVHPLVPKRRLVLGGVEIPFDKGLSGWSDADVLTHAIIDAMLGSAALGNIGTHFPSGKPESRDISSLTLLKRVAEMLAGKGWRVGNIDATVVAEQPMLGDFINAMRRNLSQILNIEVEQISVKAVTSERMGFVGRGEGISACAVALIEGISD